MDQTGWIAVAGIAGTLLGALIGPIIAERMRRTGGRQDRLLERRLHVYADLMRVATNFVANANLAAIWPLATFKKTGPDELVRDELDRIVAQARIVSSDEVKECLGDLIACTNDLDRLLVTVVRPHLQAASFRG